MQALLPHVTKLSALMSTPSSNSEDAAAGKLSLLQLFGRLLSLDAKQVLDTAQPSFDFVFSGYCSTLASR